MFVVNDKVFIVYSRNTNYNTSRVNDVETDVVEQNIRDV